MRRASTFVAITFFLTWGLWIPAGFATGAFENGLMSAPVMVGAVALGMFVPLVSALMTNRILPETERLDLALKPRIQANFKYYLLAWFTPALMTLLGGLVFFLMNPTLFDPSGTYFVEALSQVGEIPADRIHILLIAQVIFAVALAPFVNLIPAFGEEAGWQGMLFPTLSEQMSQRGAALVLGVIWGLWHAPVTIMGHNYGMGYFGYPVTGIISMVIFCTALSSCFSYLRVRTGTVWAGALAHGALNAIVNVGIYFSVVGSTLTGPSPAGVIAGIPLYILAGFCWLKLSGQVSRKRRSQGV